MNIQVTSNIRITMDDPLNYTIEKKRVVQDGKNKGQEQWDTVGYYGGLRNAAQALLTRHFGLLAKEITAASDLKTLISAIDEGAYLIAQSCKISSVTSSGSTSSSV